MRMLDEGQGSTAPSGPPGAEPFRPCRPKVDREPPPELSRALFQTLCGGAGYFNFFAVLSTAVIPVAQEETVEVLAAGFLKLCWLEVTLEVWLVQKHYHQQDPARCWCQQLCFTAY